MPIEWFMSSYVLNHSIISTNKSNNNRNDGSDGPILCFNYM